MIPSLTQHSTHTHSTHTQVLHIVMYPRLQYDLPILGLDLVGSGNNRFSLAVLDACPVSVDRSLPPTYASAMQYVWGGECVCGSWVGVGGLWCLYMVKVQLQAVSMSIQ